MRMVNGPLAFNCPKCGKLMKKNKGEARYTCENNACSVIFVRNPDKPYAEITYDASAFPGRDKKTRG
jgi:uncharacterized C2H2 Zn-finger protein